MIKGLRTAIYPAPDLERGKNWYREVVGHDPYFDEPYYVGFSVGGFELGLIPDGEPGSSGVQGCTGALRMRWRRRHDWSHWEPRFTNPSEMLAAESRSALCAIRSATCSASSRIRSST